jgi:hypothetical protein
VQAVNSALNWCNGPADKYPELHLMIRGAAYNCFVPWTDVFSLRVTSGQVTIFFNRLEPFARIDAKFLAALPNPPVFGLVAAFAYLVRSISTSTFYLEAAPDGCRRSEQTRDELENVDCGCYADQCGYHAKSRPHCGPS